MFGKRYNILYAAGNGFGEACAGLVGMVDGSLPVVRIAFFGAPEDNGEYLSHLAAIRSEVAKRFGENKPAVSYIAQRVLTGGVAAEVTYMDPSENVTLTYGDNYIIAEGKEGREIITGAVLGEDIEAGFYEQSRDVFRQVEGMLGTYGFPINGIYRQWNYIADITGFNGPRQHYQEFNDARSEFYAKADWSGGYPAATGIGAWTGGVAVELNAMKPSGVAETVNRALDNKLQVSAHRYSQQVLIGEEKENLDHKTTPKFERARLVGIEGKGYTVYVSGTAAIRGEESLMGVGVGEQTRITMENIEYLLSEECTGLAGYRTDIQLLRVYIKEPEDLGAVREYMEKNYPQPEKVYLHADVCRDELLVEIEGVASLKF